MRPFAFAFFAVALAAPAFGADGPARRADVPEKFLSPATQFYLRWDGIAAHKEAYKNSFWGGVMSGPTGDSVQALLARGAKWLGSSGLTEPLLDTRPPAELKAALADRKAVEEVAELIADRGLIVAAEVRGPALTIQGIGQTIGELFSGKVPGSEFFLPNTQVLVIVPDVGDRAEVLFGTLRVLSTQKAPLALLFGPTEIEPFAAGGRKGFHIPPTGSGSNQVRMAWWMEGKHFVFYTGTFPLTEIVAELSTNATRGGLTGHPLFQRCLKTGNFESVTRGFIDTERVINLVKNLAGPFVPGLKERLDSNGISGLKALVFSSGFEGKASRALYEFDVPGERKGIMKVLKNVPLGVKDLPPMPPDVTRFSALRLDFPAAYDAGLGLLEFLTMTEEEGTEDDAGKKNPSALIKARKEDLAREIDKVLGISVTRDLLPHLGDKLVVFQSPGEGLQGIGTVVCISAKDVVKMKSAADRFQRGLEALVNSPIKMRKRVLKGVEYREFYARGFGIITPTYAIVDDWLVIALHPQAVQGVILRAKGDLEKWKPDAATAKRLAKMPADGCGLQYCDPRNTVSNLCVLGAPVVSALNLLADDPETDFDPVDVVLVPNSYELNRHLFPNLTVTRDDGKTIRIETNESFSLPFEWIGLETFGVLAALGLGF
jgi:hypothetical protein